MPSGPPPHSRRRQSTASIPARERRLSVAPAPDATPDPAPAPARIERDAVDLPRLPEPLLSRPQLIDRLNTWSPITVLRGFGGIGKTTQVAAWLASQAADEVSWWWPDELTAIDIDAKVRQLLAAAGARKIVIVVDAPGRPEAADHEHAALTSLVAHVQRHRSLHLVVCCRGPHVLESIAAAAPSVLTIGASELLLRPTEVAELAAAMGVAASASQLEQIHAVCGGWTPAVRLVLDAVDPARPMSASAVVEYVRSLVLADADSFADNSELVRFALPEYLDLEVIRALCGTDEASEVVTRLEASGFVVRRESADGVVWEYPPLVRDALRSTGLDRDPAWARRTHARLAGWYSQRSGAQYVLPALRHAVSAREWNLVGQLWDRRGLGLAATQPARLRAMLRDIPVEVADEHPALRVYAGAAAKLSGPAPDLDAVLHRQSAQCLRLTGEQLLAMPLPDLLYLSAGKLIAARVATDRVEVDASEIAAISDRARTELATSAEAALLGERVAWFELQVGLTMALAGSGDEALHHYQLAVEHATDAGADFIVARTAGLIALAYAVAGHTGLATNWIARRATVLAADRCQPQDGEIAARIAAGLLALDHLDGAAAGAALEALDAVAVRHELWPYLAYLRGQYALHYGEPASMLTKLAAVVRANSGPDRPLSGFAAELIGRARADLLMSLSQGQRAHSAIAVSADAGAKLPVAAARLCMQSGDHQQARLRVARAAFSSTTEPRDQLELFVIDAVAALRLGAREAARESFQRALDCSAAQGNVRVFATVDRTELAELGRLSGAEPELPRDSRSPVFGGSLVLVALTKSEVALLEALERTGSRREIAETRYVSLNTVKTQMRALYQKLGTTNRDDTLARVRELGLLA